ncbi:MAG TPA: ORF6N domain-containing protein [Ferruginibacter sp.]|nr:ORF6N domain-containing protein [Ferruginibacter sp.]
MAKEIKRPILVADEVIMNKIYVVRRQKVMIDRDLAELYGVETKVLKQAVRRNAMRFPKDFMFEMNSKEFGNWRSQFVTSNEGDKMGLRHAPFCFTEQGVTMLSCILNSSRAITINIQVIRIFSKLREMIITHKGILLKLEQLEKKITGHDENIKMIFGALKQLLNPPQAPRRRIGFRRNGEED